MANLVTLARIGLLFVAVGLLYSRDFRIAALAAPLTLFVLAGDALDGWVARRRGKPTEFGAVFDIAGDRIVENVYFIVFAHLGVLPVWMPLVVVTRSFGVDALRGVALREGRTAFGKRTMMTSSWGRALSSSRLSRGLYGAAKGVAFCLLAAVVAWRLYSQGAPEAVSISFWLEGVALGLAYFVVGFCLIRGLAVVYDARSLFIGRSQASGEGPWTTWSRKTPQEHDSL